MPSFVCDGCQTTLRKQKVAQHLSYEWHFSMDECASHISCVSEAEKYKMNAGGKKKGNGKGQQQKQQSNNKQQQQKTQKDSAKAEESKESKKRKGSQESKEESSSDEGSKKLKPETSCTTSSVTSSVSTTTLSSSSSSSTSSSCSSITEIVKQTLLSLTTPMKLNKVCKTVLKKKLPKDKVSSETKAQIKTEISAALWSMEKDVCISMNKS